MPALYLHIPFCAKKCRYCDFLSFAGCAGEEMRRYIGALAEELALLGGAEGHPGIETAFFGGGTPSLLPEGEAARVLDAVRQNFALSPHAEITIEANPGTLTQAKLAEYRAAGINRLSLGVQSFDDGVLRAAGRIHTANQAEEAVGMAHAAGFENLNADLMAGLPGESEQSLLRSVKRALQLPLTHISLYSLILEEGTPLFADVAAGRAVLPDEDEVAAGWDACAALLQQAGFLRYEVSNFARPGFECRHNLTYWQSGDFYGVGLGASGAVRRGGRTLRRRNHTAFAPYYNALKAGKLPVMERSEERGEEEAFTYLMMALRTTAGLEEGEFARRFGKTIGQMFGPALEKNLAAGRLKLDGGRLALTQTGMDFMNGVLCDFLP